MINPKVRAAALDFIKCQFRISYDEINHEFHEAYAAECRLFDEHFQGMTPEEKQEYKKFVNWLDNSRMWESDLTVDELYDVFIKYTMQFVYW
jgi:hypothetical protein